MFLLALYTIYTRMIILKMQPLSPLFWRSVSTERFWNYMKPNIGSMINDKAIYSYFRHLSISKQYFRTAIKHFSSPNKLIYARHNAQILWHNDYCRLKFKWPELLYVIRNLISSELWPVFGLQKTCKIILSYNMVIYEKFNLE